MGIVSLLYNAFSNTIAWILRLFWTKKTSQRRVQETDKDDKRDKAATEPVLVGWLSEKARYMSMPRSERRQIYSCGDNYVALGDVQEWSDYFTENQEWLKKLATGRLEDVCSINPELNKKVSIWRGDITTLEVDVIVNAANKRLLGGGGVDGAIHSAAGEMLREECATLKGCETGEAKVTGGYLLPAKYVIHTVGPVGSGDKELASCYQNSLNIMKQLKQRTLAIPCISVGIFAFPNEHAAAIALSTVRKFLEENKDHVDRIIFCLFMSSDVEVYEVLMQKYFPVCPPDVTPATPSATDTTEHKHETPPTISGGSIDKEMSPEAVTVKQASKEEVQVDLQTLAKKDDHDDLREPSSPKNQEHSEISKADAKEPMAKITKDKSETSKPSEERTKSDEIPSDLVATKPESKEKAQVELQEPNSKPVGENLKEPSPPQSQEHSENGQTDARKSGADVVMQHEENALETSQKSDDSTKLHQNLSELPTSVTETEPPNMKSEPNVEPPKNAVTEKKESDPKVKTPAMTVTEPQPDLTPEQMNTKSDPDSMKSVEPKMGLEQGSSSPKVGMSDTVTISKQRSDGDEERKDVQEGSNHKSMEAEPTSTKTELNQMAELGPDKEVDTNMENKEDENHSLMSDATDFEHISLSEASSKMTEANSSEEQQIKLDKNENMSHDAMVEDNNEHDQKSVSKI